MGLPASYDLVIINFDTTSPEQLTVEHVIARLLNEETHQNSSPDSTTSTPSDDALNGAMAVLAARRDVANVTCFFCDKKGHFKSDCPEKLAWESTKHKKKTGTATLAIGLDSNESDSEAW
ncbi:hypothetical protein DFH09DRAFT_1160302 [Mycena vulgaris]|nr:hypothetical protein DFH09DRAFT_1160302 [Mycena vulgaris]